MKQLKCVCVRSLMLVLLALVSVGCGSKDDSKSIQTRDDNGQESEVVEFPDPVLEALIRTVIRLPEGDINTTDLVLGRMGNYLYMSDIPRYVYESYDVKVIRNIEGLQYCTHLDDLNLNLQEISDITPLESLVKLRNLNLMENRITDITPLLALTALEHLEIRFNPLSDESINEVIPALKARGVIVNGY